jgi:hypothetical protein
VLAKRSPGLTLLGTYRSSYGDEWAFASGAKIHGALRYPSRFIVLQLTEDMSGGFEVSPVVYGLEAGDDLQFRYTLKTGDQTKFMSDWSSDPARQLPKPENTKELKLLIEVRQGYQSKGVVALEYPVGSSKPFEIRFLQQRLASEPFDAHSGVRSTRGASL